MKNEDKFFNLINGIETELKKLKSLNDNLSHIDNYVNEVSQIKENLLKSIKEMVSEYQTQLKNQKFLISSLNNSISSFTDTLEEQLSQLKKTNSKIIDEVKSLSDLLDKVNKENLSQIFNNIEKTENKILITINSLLQNFQNKIIDFIKKESYGVNKAIKIITLSIILNLILTIVNFILLVK